MRVECHGAQTQHREHEAMEQGKKAAADILDEITRVLNAHTVMTIVRNEHGSWIVRAQLPQPIRRSVEILSEEAMRTAAAAYRDSMRMSDPMRGYV